MKDELIFCNTGWMDFYKGIKSDAIKGGGKHVVDKGWGGEILNFKPFEGKVYGYVQPKIDRKYHNPSTIKLEKIGGSAVDEKVNNITVVWTAKDPRNGGTYIIGWYKNATVYRYEQVSPQNSNRKHKNIPLNYYATTKAKDAILLNIDDRNVGIKRQEKNWMGQSNVWYADKNPTFIKLVKDYIFKGELPTAVKKSSRKGSARQADALKRIAVEKKAIEIVSAHYTYLGYAVESFEKDNVGWDLTATNKRSVLKLEVKGLSGSIISTELTPNEYKNLKNDNKCYRICIVSNALVKPKLQIFYYSNDTQKWSSDDGSILYFMEMISVRINTT